MLPLRGEGAVDVVTSDVVGGSDKVNVSRRRVRSTIRHNITVTLVGGERSIGIRYITRFGAASRTLTETMSEKRRGVRCEVGPMPSCWRDTVHSLF